jgi:hypothetical protein
MFRRSTSSPSSGMKSKPSKKPALLAACFMLFSCLAYYLTLKMEVTRFSDMSVIFQWTTWYYIPEDRTPGHFPFLHYHTLNSETLHILSTEYLLFLWHNDNTDIKLASYILHKNKENSSPSLHIVTYDWYILWQWWPFARQRLGKHHPKARSESPFARQWILTKTPIPVAMANTEKQRSRLRWWPIFELPGS